MNILTDTNIFLEILLSQDKKNICKRYLEKNKNNIAISDFSVHSIRAYLFREKRYETFAKFSKDILNHLPLISLPKADYEELASKSKKYNLDFDDTYQMEIAMNFNMQIATLDSDFKKVQNKVEIIFL